MLNHRADGVGDNCIRYPIPSRTPAAGVNNRPCVPPPQLPAPGLADAALTRNKDERAFARAGLREVRSQLPKLLFTPNEGESA
jgi:hypothetical protein